jgi:Fe-S-cluster-containing hydrogenase component 2
MGSGSSFFPAVLLSVKSTFPSIKAPCYRGAISRVEHKGNSYEYVVDEDKCIGCGFCAGIYTCGVWEMVENI